MTSNIRKFTALQREVERIQNQRLHFSEPTTVRIMKEAQQALLQQQKLMQGAISPLRDELERHRKMMEEIRSLTDSTRMAADVRRLMASPITDELLRNQRIIDEMRALTRPNLASELRHVLPDHSLWQHVRQQQAAFEQMRLQASLVSQAFREIAWAQDLATRPTLVAAQHINETTRLITRWEEAGRPIEALAASIGCTESEAISQESEILVYPEVFDYEHIEFDDRGEEAFLPTQNLYYVQRTELIYVARSNPAFLEDQSVFDGLATMRYFQCAQTVCNYVSQINRLCRIIGRDRVFKLTEQLMQSLVALPNIVAVRHNHFCEFVDHLYFIIYEGAGKDKLRFLDLVAENDAEPVWMLKHLRNYYARHDVEHGDASDIRKKQKRLAQIFTDLSGKPLPRTRVDFGKAQLAFLQRIADMLRLIYEKVEQLAMDAASGEGGTQK